MGSKGEYMVLRFTRLINNNKQLGAAYARLKPVIGPLSEVLWLQRYRLHRWVRKLLSDRERWTLIEDKLRGDLKSIGWIEVHGSIISSFNCEIVKGAVLYGGIEQKLIEVKRQLCEKNMSWQRMSLLSKHIYRGHLTPGIEIQIRDRKYFFIRSCDK